jgi:hypothetical protein
MATWQRRSSLGSRRVKSVTAFGAVLSSLPFPFNRAAPLVAWSLAVLGRLELGAIPNFALTGFSEVRQERFKNHSFE